MMVVGIVAVCVVLAVLAFLVPRLRGPERGTQRSLGAGSRVAGKAPGPVGRLLSKPFRSSSRAVSKSGSAGRRTRGRMPF
ncbi:DUF6411 family protein [Streptomyces nitrosporeus]|uniref:Uncharacterized protein n=1 Tax=Streptomyces nitrosporeus TaxID=28894 RepID=A0A5J6F4I4_9ACTN|nr:DUF6411 family protein [Streptomyces nitrosporeus]QEU70724.1 hypothetical protein CP967_01010 [Streptomyces nitrosporeus]GGZ06679.1 hypothetical protein GCM10010327_41610 [Streptomyces nitrosporeus]